MTALRGGMCATAAALTIGLGVLAASPALAADEVGHGQASALNVGIAGMSNSVSGQYAASNDGAKQTESGSKNPALRVLGSQSLISQGTLAQDATTSVAGRVVSSAACAGLSGEGATLAAVGSSDSCFASTDTVSLNSGALDTFKNFDPFTGIIANGQLTDTFVNAFPAALRDAIRGASAQISNTLVAALQQVLDAIGNPSLIVGADAIEGQCTATRGATTADANLVDAGLTLDFGANSPVDPITVALPVDPKPNQKVVTDLSALTTAITDGLTTSLTNQSGPLAQLLGPLGVALGNLADTLNPIIGQISDQLGPIEDNILDITLNKQTKTGDSQIHETALDAQVLPAAAAATGSSLASIQVGDVDCLGGTFTPAVNPPGDGGNGGNGGSNVPTSVDAGLAGDPTIPTGVMVALGALFLVAAGGVGVRQVKLHHGKD
ncbi:hypothetical protein GCM10011519_16270 [Marmoricola endophyticus]|uniref:Choice-of-anchor G family protein n=1 Tax=Marmoricola endophyticus TaxID=2040280 RepID=A0A917BIL4_9ACTN|nr:hypothetical protein [Marmoricola endophyticus]GGF43135.1 hypothetical protein GCM10011519_16270 [Marmoricola endophyticus]